MIRLARWRFRLRLHPITIAVIGVALALILGGIGLWLATSSTAFFFLLAGAGSALLAEELVVGSRDRRELLRLQEIVFHRKFKNAVELGGAIYRLFLSCVNGDPTGQDFWTSEALANAESLEVSCAISRRISRIVDVESYMSECHVYEQLLQTESDLLPIAFEIGRRAYPATQVAHDALQGKISKTDVTFQKLMDNFLIAVQQLIEAHPLRPMSPRLLSNLHDHLDEWRKNDRKSEAGQLLCQAISWYVSRGWDSDEDTVAELAQAVAPSRLSKSLESGRLKRAIGNLEERFPRDVVAFRISSSPARAQHIP